MPNPLKGKRSIRHISSSTVQLSTQQVGGKMVSRRKNIFDDCHDRKLSSFPDSHPLILSHNELPASYQVMEESAQDYGFTLTPFIKNDSYTYIPDVKRHYDVAARVARCINTSCTGYMNPFCDTTNMRWFCSMCGYKNNITRTQNRYRHIDMKLLPELQDALVDYRAALFEQPGPKQRTEDGQSYDTAVYSTPVAKRPLVHVFVVQESMQLDSLQATVEALTAAVADLHPEIQIVLLTFSHRIGIYRFKKGSAVPSVQYVHFLALPGTEPPPSTHFSAPVEGIFEGHNLQELDPAYRIELSMPLSAVVGMQEAACEIGDCRDAFVAAVGALFDAFSGDSSAGDADEHLPKVMMGPTLEAVHAWLSVDTADSFLDYTSNPEYIETNTVNSPSTHTDADHFRTGPGAAPTTPSELSSLFANLTMGLWSSVVGGSAQDSSSAKAKAEASLVPADAFTGVVMHYFLDAPQDLRFSSHDSVAQPLVASSGAPLAPQLDRSWVSEQAALVSKLSLCVNIWSIVNFDSRELGLSALQPLVTPTGGRINRTVLGHHPAQERARLSECLRRSVTCARATRGILKMRGSVMVDFLPDLATGGMVQDANLPGVYRIASCTPENTFGMQLKYNLSQAKATQLVDTVVLQMAYSYETVVESKELFEKTVEPSESPRTPHTPGGWDKEKEGDGIGVDEEGDADGAVLYTDSDEDEEIGNDIDDSHHHHTAAAALHAAHNPSALTQSAPGSVSKPSQSGKLSAAKRAKYMMDTQPGYFEHSVEQLGLAPIQAQVARYYHTTDATVASRRQAASFPEYAGLQRGFMLSQQPNRSTALNNTHKLIVVKYLRIFTMIVECSDKPLSVQLQTNPQMYVSMLMRRAIRLERDYRLFHRYTSHTSHVSALAGKAEDTVIAAFTSRIPMDSPGVALLVNSLIRHIIKVSHFYASEKQMSRSLSANQLPAKGRRNLSNPVPSNPAPQSKVDIEQVVNEVFAYPAVRDLLLYVFAAVDKMTYYNPIVGQNIDEKGIPTGEYLPYMSDEGCVLESVVESVDASQLSKLLHPLLVPVTADLRLCSEFLPLTRRSLVMSDQKYFFLDAGTDFILYRAVGSTTQGTVPSATSSEGHFKHLLEVCKLEADFADLCVHAAAQARVDYPISRSDTPTTVDSEGDLMATESAKMRTKSTRGQFKSQHSDALAPRVVSQMYNGDFLLLYLQRRVKNATIVPRVQVCDAGTGSASVFDAYLLEDHSRSGLSYQQFVEYVMEVVKRDMV